MTDRVAAPPDSAADQGVSTSPGDLLTTRPTAAPWEKQPPLSFMPPAHPAVYGKAHWLELGAKPKDVNRLEAQSWVWTFVVALGISFTFMVLMHLFLE